MKKLFILLSVVAISLTSCGTKKKIADLEARNKEIQDLLNTCTVKQSERILETKQYRFDQQFQRNDCFNFKRCSES
jgi:hypothetical protein